MSCLRSIMVAATAAVAFILVLYSTAQAQQEGYEVLVEKGVSSLEENNLGGAIESLALAALPSM